MRCSCSIHDVRREQILESSGRHWIRLVCNVCESILDERAEDLRERMRLGTNGSRPEKVAERNSHEQ